MEAFARVSPEWRRSDHLRCIASENLSKVVMSMLLVTRPMPYGKYSAPRSRPDISLQGATRVSALATLALQ
jgi:hypothetical protein